jgi:hypothetical protein
VEVDKLADKGAKMPPIENKIYKGVDTFIIIREHLLERNIFRYIKDIRKKQIKNKLKQKPKRGKPWRDAKTDKTKSAEITKLFESAENNVVNFIFKARQMLLHNRKEMYRRTDTNKRDNYT